MKEEINLKQYTLLISAIVKKYGDEFTDIMGRKFHIIKIDCNDLLDFDLQTLEIHNDDINQIVYYRVQSLESKNEEPL